MLRKSCSEPVLLVICLLVLTACGGGGGGSSPTPAPPAIDPTNEDPPDDSPVISFTDITADSGLSRRWDITTGASNFIEEFASGLAAADYDEDGDIDLFATGGDFDPNHLYENQGDGSFVEIGRAAGLDFLHRGSGPNFSDYDGDGDLDLFVGAVQREPHFLFENRDGLFVNVTSSSGINITVDDTISSTFSDYDNDGDLDLFLSHWGASQRADTETLWRNNGDGSFTSASIESGIAEALIETDQTSGLGIDRTFTPNLSDIDNDGDVDLLMAADFETSQVFVNNGDSTFTRVTDRNVIVDQSGMGAAVGDYDNDGDMDWFVTSILQQPDQFGNRLYRNVGSAAFEDVTDEAGVADGGWGWGACFADFDNDGHLDLFHVNGWRGTTGADIGRDSEFSDQVRFFHNQGDGTFEEQASMVGLGDNGQGRGVACFDAERDGDIDIVISNNDEEQFVYYRNDSTNDNHYISMNLVGNEQNTRGIGAWVTAETAEGAQVREVRAGNNYVSQNPPEVHFGLGDATSVDLVVRWPDGSETVRSGVTTDQLLTIEHE
ncbi:MAG TPA: CRTAC1 family protein [Gammaproteobacteria bacterium]|nr:CRTAC1 family protein [Gammaproteobacteria bacterium]